jgi:hypothetical protein
LNHVRKTKGVARLRKAAAFTVTTIALSVVASHARAELHDGAQVLSLQAAHPAQMELALPHVRMMTTPFFLLLPIGVSGRASFRLPTRSSKRPMVSFGGEEGPLCLGARCAPRIGSKLMLEPGVAERSGSTNAVESIGIGKAALALFAAPIPKKNASAAFGVSPMFACSGAGLEMRISWW